MRHDGHADALGHMNQRHADGLVAIARALAGHPETVAARAEGVDRHGLDLRLETPGGPVAAPSRWPPPVWPR